MGGGDRVRQVGRASSTPRMRPTGWSDENGGGSTTIPKACTGLCSKRNAGIDRTMRPRKSVHTGLGTNNNRPDGGNGKNGQLSGPISKVRFNPSEIVHQYWSTMQQRFRPVPFPGSRMWIWYGTYWIGRTHQFDRLPTWGKEIRRYSWRLVQGGLVPETDPNYRVPVERKKGS